MPRADKVSRRPQMKAAMMKRGMPKGMAQRIAGTKPKK